MRGGKQLAHDMRADEPRAADHENTHPAILSPRGMSRRCQLSFLTGVLPNVWSSVAFAFWLHCAFVLPEEAYLRREQGAAFVEYARRVPRWVPLIRA